MVEFLNDDASLELISKLPPDMPLSSFYGVGGMNFF
jgi:hypothetical protein